MIRPLLRITLLYLCWLTNNSNDPLCSPENQVKRTVFKVWTRLPVESYQHNAVSSSCPFSAHFFLGKTIRTKMMLNAVIMLYNGAFFTRVY
jgi:hypothetical protein